MKISLDAFVKIDEGDEFLYELFVHHPVYNFRSDLIVVARADDKTHDQIGNARGGHVSHNIVDEILAILEQSPRIFRMLLHQTSNDFREKTG